MKFFQSLHKVICNLTPYFALAAFALLVVNYIDTQKVKKQISSIQSDVSDLEYSINSIDTDYDNSDVIDEIQGAVWEIENEIHSAKSSIESTIMIWN